MNSKLKRNQTPMLILFYIGRNLKGKWVLNQKVKTNLTLKEMGLLRGIENDYKGNLWEDWEGRMSASLYHDEWDMKVYRGVMSSLAKKGIIEIGEPEKGGRKHHGKLGCCESKIHRWRR